MKPKYNHLHSKIRRSYTTYADKGQLSLLADKLDMPVNSLRTIARKLGLQGARKGKIAKSKGIIRQTREMPVKATPALVRAKKTIVISYKIGKDVNLGRFKPINQT